MDEFITFQSFYTREEAKPIAELLEKHGIKTEVKKAKVLDTIITGDDQDRKVYLNIRSIDFNLANKILEEEIELNLPSIGDDYYLYSFSDEDLVDIVYKPDEWSKQDFLLAKKILNQRGISFDDRDIFEMKHKRIIDLAKPERADAGWITLGYILSLAPVVGLLFGLAYLKARKILPDGTRVAVYDEVTKNHGRNIVIISIIMMVIAIFTGFRYLDLQLLF
jgi:hypothetical protein